MKAMILAAGRGERLRPLTDTTPKPLLDVGGKPLIVHHIEHLRAAGIQEFVINTAWLGTQLEAALGDGQDLGVQIQWSHESTALETAGGIAQALDLLGDAPFLVVNGDVLCRFDVAALVKAAEKLDAHTTLAHLLMVENPAHNPHGDFDVLDHIILDRPGYTFSGIAAYHPALFAALPKNTPAKLAPLLREAMALGQVQGEVCYNHTWHDVGTPERLQRAQQQVQAWAWIETARQQERDGHLEHALEHWKHAADLGDQEACFHYAIACWQGFGREADLLEAQRWLAIAADMGDLRAQGYLGDFLHVSDPQQGRRYKVKAFHSWLKRAVSGDRQAADYVTSYYLNGDAVAANTARAIRWSTQTPVDAE